MTFSGYADREATVGAKNGRRRLGPTHVPSSRVSIMYKADAFGPTPRQCQRYCRKRRQTCPNHGVRQKCWHVYGGAHPTQAMQGGRLSGSAAPRLRRRAKDGARPVSSLLLPQRRLIQSWARPRSAAGHGIDREICCTYRFSCEGGRRQGTLPCSQPLLCIPSSFLWRRDFLCPGKAALLRRLSAANARRQAFMPAAAILFGVPRENLTAADKKRAFPGRAFSPSRPEPAGKQAPPKRAFRHRRPGSLPPDEEKRAEGHCSRRQRRKIP